MQHQQIIWLSGAGSGIGRGLAVALLRKGHRLALTGRREAPLEELRQEVEPGEEERVLVLPADVSIPSTLEIAYTRLKDTWGVPDMVIANAGTHQHTELDRLTFSESRAIIDVNLLGAIRMLTLPLQGMVDRGSGTLVGVASLAGYRGLPAATAYGASKAGLINFLESLRFDAEPLGIRVQIVNPGFVKTPLTDQNPFEMPMLISVEQAVAALMNGLEKGRDEIHFPTRFSRIMKLLRILPYPLYKRLIRKITQGGAR